MDLVQIDHQDEQIDQDDMDVDLDDGQQIDLEDPEPNLVQQPDVHLSSILSDKVLYSWGDNEDVGRKVIVISSCLLEDIDSATKIALMDAADKCVSVDFVLLEKKSNGRGALSESIDNFNRNICDLENCSFRNHLSDAKVLCALVREWLKDLRDEAEQLQARLKFKRNTSVMEEGLEAK